MIVPPRTGLNLWQIGLGVLIVAVVLPSQSLRANDLQGMDRETRPQDDFFEYANGGWIRTTEIPPDQGRWGSFMNLRDEAAAHVREIVEQISLDEDLPEGSGAQKIRDLYRSFVDVEAIEQKGWQPLQAQLASLESLQDKQALVRSLAATARAGISSPLRLNVDQDDKSPEQYTVVLGQSGLGLPDRDYYFDDDANARRLREQYVEYVARLLALVDSPEPKATAERVMALETAIAEHHWTNVENRDREKTYNKISTRQLVDRPGPWNWQQYLKSSGVAQQESLVVRQPSYLVGLQELFDKYSLDDWKTYLKVRWLSDTAPYLSSEFEQLDFEFYGQALRGLEEPEPRWKRGVELLNGGIGQLVGQQYVERHFPPEAKLRMEKLVANLKLSMQDSLSHLEWMTETTRQQALVKLSKFNTKIGYPDQWKDYADLEINNDLIGNIRRIAQFDYEYDLQKLGHEVDRGEWFMNPQTVNAYYNASMNEIVFPAAILQPPFFDLDADDAVNYGAIGAVIGHEIGHGFDDQGRKSDGDGMLRDWWSRKDAVEYEARADKLVEQYNEFQPLEDLHVNGRLTLGENIGDLGGVTIAYRAYLRSLDGKDPEVVDGFTGQQRFFLAFARIWRMKSRDDTLRQQLKTDPHSPPRYRVVGVLRNFSPFYEAFQVQPGDGMYLPAEQRVSIW